METFKPDEPSGINYTDVGKEIDRQKRRVTALNFGLQDAQKARHFGHELARYEFDYEEAEAEIWREAWQLYPNSRFFARCFVQEAKNAYRQAVEKAN
jgi:hypothetical protein